MANETQAGGTIAILGATAVAVVGALVGTLYWIRSEPPKVQEAAPAQQAPAQPSETAPSQASPKPPAPAEKKAAAAEAPVSPSFDVVRVEPDGESVIAGRAAPGATIELMRGDQVHARTVADASGLFAIVPPPLPPGSHQIVLQSIAPDGSRQRSQQSVTVVISDAKTRPLVALTAPDKPTVLLSNPEPPEAKASEPPKAETKTADATAPAAKPAEIPVQAPPQKEASAAPNTPASSPAPTTPPPPAARPDIKIVTVETEEGKLFVSGVSAPGATVRLYLNESLIAPGGAGGDGKVSFAIASGVKPGDYRIRLDDVDPVSGQVKSRAEVAFNVPVQVAAAQAPSPAPASQAPAAPPAPAQPAAEVQTSMKTASALPDAPMANPGNVVVIPNINTAIVSRGDNLWRISQRIYGKGYRYTVIYGANQEQIRNPNLIYPGQVFVLPGEREKASN